MELYSYKPIPLNKPEASVFLGPTKLHKKLRWTYNTLLSNVN